MDSENVEKINELLKTGVTEAFKEFQKDFRAIVEAEIKKEFKNAEQLAKFLTRIETQQERLINCIEELAKATKMLLEGLKKRGRISYAS